MEKRIETLSKSSPLPLDYLKMVRDVFRDNFKEALVAYCALLPKSDFEVSGAVYNDEVVLAVSLAAEGHLAATTLYASVDFDPKASAPTIEELLSACVDALGTQWADLLNTKEPEKLEHLAHDSLSALEDVPFQWTKTESNRRSVFVKIDKANLKVEAQADEWLAKNDPDHLEKLQNEEEDTKKLFVTGPKKNSKPE